MQKKEKIENVVSIPVPGTKEQVDNQSVLSVSKTSRANSRANIGGLLEEFKRTFMQISKSYKSAKLYFGKGDLSKEWYVEYGYLIPGQLNKYKRFKERFDMNRIPDLKDRLVYGKEAVCFMNEKLAQGFNPFTANNYRKGYAGFTIIQQLEMIVAELSAGETANAIRSFNDRYNRFKKYLEAKQLTDITGADLTLDHAEGFKVWMLTQKFSRKTINETLAYVSRYFNLALKKKWISENHFLQVDKIKGRQYRVDEGQRERFEPITSVEMDLIFETLQAKKETAFIAYLAFIYYAWIRPAEICRLHIADIELKRGVIKLKMNDTKNNLGAYVQIVPPLIKILEKMELDKYPFSHYVFGRNTFLPGKEKIGKNSCANKWKAIVKDGLKIDKDMYALKHTGNIDYLLKNKGNTDLKWQQAQNRHKTSAMTDRYNRKLGAYFINCDNLNFRQI